METLKELVELAKNATPGKWRRSSTVFNGITATPFSLEFRKEVMLAHCPEKRDAMFIAAANPEAILAIAEAFRAMKQHAEAADALNNHLELAVRKAEGVSESLRRRAEDAENKLLFTRSAPAADLDALVPDREESRKLFEKACHLNRERNPHHPDYYLHLPAREKWDAWEACRAAILRKIEEAK